MSPPAAGAANRRPLGLALAIFGILGVVIFAAISSQQSRQADSSPVSVAAPSSFESGQPIATPPASVPSPPGPSSARPQEPADKTSAVRPAPSAEGGVGAQDSIARVKRSTVLILSKLQGGVASGTGFVVGTHLIGTCAHVVAGAEGIAIVFADGHDAAASVAAIDEGADVALLTCSAPLPPTLPLGSYAEVQEGDEIAVTGYPKFFDLTAIGMAPAASTTRGYVSAKRERQTEYGPEPEIQIDASVNHGNSGGPVYRTQDGVVVALAAATIADSQGLNFATPVDGLRRLMGRAAAPGTGP